MFETLLRIALDAGATSKPAKIRLSEAKAPDGGGAVAIQMRCPAHDVMPESVGASGRASGASARTSATDFGLEFCKRVAALHGGVLSVSYPGPADMVVTVSLNADQAF
jgi:hypothetical protein